tara:strand:+ start:142 stop:1191 length:1050 start_codon:yes stop_codon:yes gene_type:complete
MAGDAATAADLQKMGLGTLPKRDTPTINPETTDIALTALQATNPVSPIQMEERIVQPRVEPPASSFTNIAPTPTAVTAPNAMMSLLDQPISQDPFENLSKSQRTMLAFAAIKDAGMALQGKEGTAFSGTLTGFRERADMERKRRAALAQRQMLQGVFGGVTPVTGDTTMTPDALRQRIAQLSQFAMAFPERAQGFSVEIKRLEGEVERLTQAEKSLVAQNQGVAAVDALLNSPDLAKIAGFSGTVNEFFEKFRAAPEYSTLMSYVKQLEGLNFVEAFQQLKGGGPITDLEGAKATAARTRLEQALKGNVEDLKVALIEARELFDEARVQNPMYSGQMLGLSEEDKQYLK